MTAALRFAAVLVCTGALLSACKDKQEPIKPKVTLVAVAASAAR